MIRNTLLFVVLSAFVSCQFSNNVQRTNEGLLMPDSTFLPLYAKGFKIDYYKGFKIITINDAFDSLRPPQTILLSYSQNAKNANELYKADQYINGNVERWVTLSSTHISTSNLLDVTQYVVGVAEPQYISDSVIKQKLAEHKIRNVGMAMAPDFEVVLSVKPSFVMVSPFPDITYSQIKNAGIAVVPNGSYLENTPLGRAEWMIFMAALFNKEPLAVKLFSNIEARYLKTKQIAAQATNYPSIFTGNLYQGIWNASMGNNYMANYFADAGAKYIYSQIQGSGTLSLEFEKIFHDAANAEYWLLIINHPGSVTYETIGLMEPKYKVFGAYKNKRIIYTNAHNSLYFEKAEIEPDVVLADISHALHPHLNPGYLPVYFKLLQD